jgi:hypothetical protein
MAHARSVAARAQSTDTPDLVAARKAIWAQVQAWLAEPSDDGDSPSKKALTAGLAITATAAAIMSLVVCYLLWKRAQAQRDGYTDELTANA